MRTRTIPFTIRGFVADPETQQPVLVLHDEARRFALPLWIGVPEAGAIAAVLEGEKLPRPMVHDLLATAIGSLGGRVLGVLIRAVEGGTFLADLELVDAGGRRRVLDCRPSDAIAVAVRTGAPIRVAARVLEFAQLLDPEEQAAVAAEAPPVTQSPGPSPEGQRLGLVSADDVAGLARLMDALDGSEPEDFGKFRA